MISRQVSRGGKKQVCEAGIADSLRIETVTMTHHLKPTSDTLRGCFSMEMTPCLTVDSGDTVIASTLEAGWGLEAHHLDGSPRRTFERVLPRDRGHCLIGPIEVRGAQPGQTLTVEILAIEPGDFGWNVAGGWATPLNDRLGLSDAPECFNIWTLDRSRTTWSNQRGWRIDSRPFLGVLGMPPPEPGIHSTFPPRAWGGNLDCKELIAGTTLFLPIPVKGALFSFGDGHGAQGDGEVSGTAIECPMRKVELLLSVVDSPTLASPRARTPEGWVTFGLAEDLDDAMALAVDDMLNLMGSEFGIGRSEALSLASLAVDLRVTQVVNGVVGVHAVLPNRSLSRDPG